MDKQYKDIHIVLIVENQLLMELQDVKNVTKSLGKNLNPFLEKN